MKAINTLFFICACFALNAQTPIDGKPPKVMTVTKTETKPFNFSLPGEVLIDQDKRQPSLIIKSTLDTIEGDYLTDAGIFRGYVVRKTHKVMYAAHEAHNGLELDQVIAVLDDKQKPVKGVLGCRLLEYVVTDGGIRGHNLWFKNNTLIPFNKN